MNIGLILKKKLNKPNKKEVMYKFYNIHDLNHIGVKVYFKK